MKVLLYGVGVIGSLTAHELCRAGNEVTVIARGRWKEVLEQQGLRIHAYSGNKEWTDYPEVLGEYDRNTYDVVFSIMQNQQQTEIVDTLACVQAKYVVLVGNNLQSEKMQQQLIDYGWNANQIIFGFQTSAGVRHEDYTEVITFGTPELTIGHVSSDVSDKEKRVLSADIRHLRHEGNVYGRHAKLVSLPCGIRSSNCIPLLSAPLQSANLYLPRYESIHPCRSGSV